MDPQLRAPDTDREDEVTHQRRKHWDASLMRSVPGFGTVTLSQLVADVRGATAEAGGNLDVTGLLAGQGHSQETIEAVRSYLGLEWPMESRRQDLPSAASGRLSGSRRLRAVERLQALLLEE